MSFKKIKPEELQKNPFQMIGKEWLLVTAEKDGKANTMTASWGGVGVMWGRNVAFIVIRPQRYTKEFIDASDKLFSLFLMKSTARHSAILAPYPEETKTRLPKSGLTVAHTDDVPYFAEANTVITGKKLYAQEYRPECFIDSSLDEKWYPQKDYHTMYILEIEKILVRE